MVDGAARRPPGCRPRPTTRWTSPRRRGRRAPPPCTAMAERMPVTGTWPLRKPELGGADAGPGVDRPRGPDHRQAGDGGRPVRWRRSGRPVGSPRRGRRPGGGRRTASTVTIESMPPPKGTSGPVGRRWTGHRPVGAGRLGPDDLEAGEIEPVAVGELAQALEVEGPQERPLGVGGGQCRPGRPPAGRPSCSTRRRPGGRPAGPPRRSTAAEPVAPGLEGDLLGEAARRRPSSGR